VAVHPGACYWRDTPPGSIPHFFFVISDTLRDPERVVLVPMTSVNPDKFIDPACLLEPGDHLVIQHASFLHFGRAIVMSTPAIEHALRARTMAFRGAATAALLERMRAGAEESEHMRERPYTVLYEQGLVKPF